MADRYWVGGTGTWDATSTTNWATSSGGSSGASAPTSADNVIFDAASNTGTNAFTVTIGGTSASPSVCNDFTTGGAGGALDGVMTLSMGDTAQLDIHGSMTLPASNLTWSGAGNANQHSLVNFKATTTGKTITTNGVSIVTTEFKLDGVGGAWTLGSAFTRSGVLMQDFTIENGTFSTSGSNYSMTIAGIGTSTSTSRTINLNASTVTITGGSGAVNLTSSTNLTLNAGTSQITCSAASPTFAGGGLTYYNVSFTSAASGTVNMTGANTFNNLTQTSRSATGYRFIELGANQTVSGALTLGAANTAIRRVRVVSDITGTQRTITCNGTLAALADVDFKDINAAGTVATPWTGTRIGNLLGNSNITFTAAADKYWNLAAGGNWSGTGWALSSGGAVAANNFPLAQDKVIIENTGLNTSATITIDQRWQIGELDISTRTNAMTLASGNTFPAVYKNITLSSAVTMTVGTGYWTMFGQGTTQILDVNTVTFVPPIEIDVPTGTFQLAENTTCSGTVTLTQGTLDLNDFDLTCNIFSSTNSNTRVIDFGTGDIILTGNDTTVLSFAIADNFTYTGTPTVNSNYSGSTGDRLIQFGSTSGATESNVLNVNTTAGTDQITYNGSFKNIILTGFSGTLLNRTRNVYGNLTISSGSTLEAGTLITTFAATSGTQDITSNGKTFDFPITQDGVGGTVRLLDNLTIGSTRTLTLTNGTLNLNNFNLSTGLFSSNNSNTRVLTLGTGAVDITGSGSTAFDITDGTNLTVNRGTSIINMSSTSSKTFAGGGKTYYRLIQNGTGALTLTGANTFHDISNTVQPTTINFPASTTTSVSNFSARGTSGNLISLRSSTPGTQFTLTYIP
jgi:hypothetical protein